MIVAELLAKLKLKPDKSSFDAADKMIGAVKGALLGLAAAVGVVKLTGLIQDTVDLGGHLQDMSEKTGTTVETLQELGYAAEQNGSSMDAVSSTLTKLSSSMSKAGKGSKEQAEAFSHAGIKIKDAAGKIRPSADVFGDIADHIASLDKEDRAAAAISLLGKSGAELVPTLKDGSAGLKAYAENLRELGGVMSSEDVAALDEFGDQQNDVKKSLAGLRNTVVVELMPTLRAMVKDLLAWIKANRQLIAQKLKSVLEGIIGALKIFATVVGVAVKVLSFLSNNLDIVIMGLSALGIAMVIFKGKAIATAIATAAAWAMAAAPFVIIALGLMAIILIIEDLYTWFSGGDSVLGEFFGYFKTWIGDKLKWLWDHTIGFMIDKAKEFFNWVGEKITALWESIKSVGEAINEFFTGDTVMSVTMKAAKEAADMGLTGDAARAHVQSRLGEGGFAEVAAPTIDLGSTAGGAPASYSNSGTKDSSYGEATVSVKIKGDVIDQQVDVNLNRKLVDAKRGMGKK